MNQNHGDWRTQTGNGNCERRPYPGEQTKQANEITTPVDYSLPID